MRFIDMWFYEFMRLIFAGPLVRRLYALEVKGKENIPKGRPVVVAATHGNGWDPVWVGITFPGPMRIVAKVQLLTTAIRRFFFVTLLRVIPVDRKGTSNAMREMITLSVATLKRGISVLIFPEGSRARDGRLHKLRHGAILIAVKGDAPLMPAFVKRVRTPDKQRDRVIIIFGTLIETAGKRPAEIMEELKQQLIALSGYEYVDEYLLVEGES